MGRWSARLSIAVLAATMIVGAAQAAKDVLVVDLVQDRSRMRAGK